LESHEFQPQEKLRKQGRLVLDHPLSVLGARRRDSSNAKFVNRRLGGPRMSSTMNLCEDIGFNFVFGKESWQEMN
jgi:hypothetical protein